MLNLKEYNLELSSAELLLLEKHLQFVLDYNQKVQLTAIRDYNEGILLHIVDSLMGLKVVNSLKEGRLLDMGSGGGFPGIPLAICTNRQVDLLDSVKKKMRGLELFIEEENLTKRVSTHDVRAEELALKRRGYYSVITARALSSLPSLIELASPLLSKGGALVAYKGAPNEEEIIRANNAARLAGMRFLQREDYILPTTEFNRSLLVYIKQGEGKIKLPRRVGLAQKSPLA